MTTNSQVLVTGASGFIAKHCIAVLLREGYRVRGTVRDSARRRDIETAIERAGAPHREIELVQTDLLRDAGWAEAVAGCDYVLHVASPFPADQPRDPNELIRPAREGAQRVIRAAKAAGVKRIVQTSSVAAVMLTRKPNGVVHDENDWTDTASGTHSAYAVSKTLAERAAWDEIESDIDVPRHVSELVVINPGFVLGPALDGDLSTSHTVLQLMARGAYPALPKLAFPVVDVRDVAQMHVLALNHPKAVGKRFVCADKTITLRQIAELMVAEFPDLARRVPRREAPSTLLRLAAFFDPKLRSIRGDLGRTNLVSNERARSDLGFTFRPASEAVTTAVKSMRQLSLI